MGESPHFIGLLESEVEDLRRDYLLAAELLDAARLHQMAEYMRGRAEKLAALVNAPAATATLEIQGVHTSETQA